MSQRIKPFLFALFLSFALGGCKQPSANGITQQAPTATETASEISNATIEHAYSHKLSDVQVSGKGVVVKLLADDNKGSRHQKFLVRINPEQTLLFAHNIDLAPRVPLQVDDEISFNGEYVYNPKGGVIHWTHHAPQGDHEAGWVMLNGQKYQ